MARGSGESLWVPPYREGDAQCAGPRAQAALEAWMAPCDRGRDSGFVRGKLWSDAPEDPAWGRAASSFGVNIPALRSTASLGILLFCSPLRCAVEQEASRETCACRFTSYDKVNTLVTSTGVMAPEALPCALSHSPPPNLLPLLGALAPLTGLPRGPPERWASALPVSKHFLFFHISVCAPSFSSQRSVEDPGCVRGITLGTPSGVPRALGRLAAGDGGQITCS